MKRYSYLQFAATLFVGVSFGACGGDEGEAGDGVSECASAKCDTPSGPDDKQCAARQAEVLNSSQRGFLPSAVRWACADVEGVNAVNRDDRGQEYCEYFALFQPPADDGGERPDAVDLGRPTGTGGTTTEHAVCVEGRGGEDCRVTLTEDQAFALEDDPSAIVGACVFTSWHADVKDDICDGGSCGEEQQIFGFPFTAENFRMKVSFNSNRAAADLVERCFDPSGADQVPDDWSNLDDPMTEPFYRGCMEVQSHFGTGWRRSDPSVCAASNRLAECGCSVPGVTNGKQLGDALVPPQPGDGQSGEVTFRGFPLGTWDDMGGLPPGCRYGDYGDDSRTLVLCDLSAADVFNSLNDPKEACRAAYGSNVVVHVPIPAEAVTCNPPDTAAAATCGEVPWNIGQEGEPIPGGDGGESGGADSGGADSGGADSGGADTGSADTGSADTGSGSNNCGEARSEAGCSDACIQDCVCEQDGFCCDNQWDDTCVGEVASFNCNDTCGAAAG